MLLNEFSLHLRSHRWLLWRNAVQKYNFFLLRQNILCNFVVNNEIDQQDKELWSAARGFGRAAAVCGLRHWPHAAQLDHGAGLGHRGGRVRAVLSGDERRMTVRWLQESSKTTNETFFKPILYSREKS